VRRDESRTPEYTELVLVVDTAGFMARGLLLRSSASDVILRPPMLALGLGSLSDFKSAPQAAL